MRHRASARIPARKFIALTAGSALAIGAVLAVTVPGSAVTAAQGTPPLARRVGVAALVQPASPVATPQSAGALPIGNASYAVPSGALVVAPNGNDAAAGTVAAPLRTVARAVARAASNSAIVLRAGLYHEAVSVPSAKRLTIQNYPGEAAWLEGSSQLVQWRAVGKTWVHDNWYVTFSHSTGGSSGSGDAFNYIDPAYPMAAYPDQVWIDNVALAQVASASAVTTGKFFVDTKNHQLVIGSTPAQHTVRASDLGIALTMSAANSVLRGIGVRRYGNSVADLGAVRLTGNAATIENVAVTDTAAAGLLVVGTTSLVRSVTLQRNGQIGMLASTADGLRIDDSLIQGNNTEHFKKAPVAGGVKITRTRGVKVTNTVSKGNGGTGVWFDESCYNVLVTGSLLMRNLSHGVSMEISSVGLFANNISIMNSNDGFKINDATHVKLWNNSIYGDGKTMELVQDKRRGSDVSFPGHDTRQHQPDPTVTWLLGDVTVANNVIGASAPGGYDVYARDYSGARAAGQMGLTIDGNMVSTRSPGAEFVWGRAGGDPQVFSTVAQFIAATGGGIGNGETSDPAGRTVSGTKAAAPLGLPSDVAAAIGQRAGTKHVGNF